MPTDLDLESALAAFLYETFEELPAKGHEEPGVSAESWGEARQLQSFGPLVSALERDEDVQRDWKAFPNFLQSKMGGDISGIVRNLLIEASRRGATRDAGLAAKLAREAVDYFRRDHLHVLAISPVPYVKGKEELYEIDSGLFIAKVPEDVAREFPTRLGSHSFEIESETLAVVSSMRTSKVRAYDESLREGANAKALAVIEKELLCYLSWLVRRRGFWCWMTHIQLNGVNPFGYVGCHSDPDPDLPFVANEQELTSEHVEEIRMLRSRFHSLTGAEQTILFTALEYGTRGLAMNSQRFAVVFYNVALERLFLSDVRSGPKKDTLARRVARFLADGDGEDKIREQVIAGYDLRNHAAHGFKEPAKSRPFPLGAALTYRNIARRSLRAYLCAEEERRFLLHVPDYWR